MDYYSPPPRRLLLRGVLLRLGVELRMLLPLLRGCTLRVFDRDGV